MGVGLPATLKIFSSQHSLGPRRHGPAIKQITDFPLGFSSADSMYSWWTTCTIFELTLTPRLQAGSHPAQHTTQKQLKKRNKSPSPTTLETTLKSSILARYWLDSGWKSKIRWKPGAAREFRENKTKISQTRSQHGKITLHNVHTKHGKSGSLHFTMTGC